MSTHWFLFGPTLLFLVALAWAPAGGRDAPGKAPEVKRFTLRGDKVLLSKALAELAGQTGARVEDGRGEADAPIRVDLDGVTFWEALDAIADAAGAVPSLTSRDGRIRLVKRPAGYRKPPTSYDKDFRVTLRRASLTRDLDAEQGACTLNFEVAWVPGLSPLFFRAPAALRLLDDKKDPLPGVEGGGSQVDPDGKSFVTFDVTVPAPPRSAARLGLVEGTLRAVTPNKMLTFTFETLDQLVAAGDKGPQRRLTQEGAVCRVDKLTLVRDRWTVRVSLELPPESKALESFQAGAWVTNNEMVLVRADGTRRLASNGYVAEDVSSRRAKLSYHFTDKALLKGGRPADWKVQYRMPGRIVEVPVTFRFADVPLP
jgi:hypothetical protein